MYATGFDYHKKDSHLVLMDEKGEVLQSRKIHSNRQAVKDFFKGYSHQPVRVAIEASRSCYSMVDILQDLGLDVKLVHPLKVKAIASAKIKNDKIDAKILADLLRADLLPAAHLRNKENRTCQAILRQRSFYVAMRTRIKNRIHALIDRQPEEVRGLFLMVNDLFGNQGLALLKSLKLAPIPRQLLDSLIQSYEEVSQRIGESQKFIRSLLEESAEAQLLASIPGIGDFFAVLIATEVDDIHRFDGPARLHSYIGIVPSVRASGEHSYTGRITRQGNKWLRFAFVEAVWGAIRSNSQARQLYDRVKYRKGPNPAKMAVARWLATLAYRVLKEKRPFYEKRI